MAEGRRPWGKVRQLPSGRYQASYILGSVRGGDPGTRYTALQTFDAKGDAWGWLDREHRLDSAWQHAGEVDRVELVQHLLIAGEVALDAIRR